MGVRGCNRLVKQMDHRSGSDSVVSYDILPSGNWHSIFVIKIVIQDNESKVPTNNDKHQKRSAARLRKQ